MYNPDKYLAQVLKALFVCLHFAFFFFCWDLAVIIFPTLLAHFKDPIQNWDRVPALWAELHIAHAALFFDFNIIMVVCNVG